MTCGCIYSPLLHTNLSHQLHVVLKLATEMAGEVLKESDNHLSGQSHMLLKSDWRIGKHTVHQITTRVYGIMAPSSRPKTRN